MRTLSSKTKYALKALQLLARQKDGEPVLIADIARDCAIPKKYLEAILLELKNRGVLESRKGKGGGYFLRKPASQVKLGEIVRILDGPLAPLSCVSETAFRKCDECDDEATCGTRSVMKEVRDAIANVLDKTTLAQLCERADKLGRTRSKFMYFI